jgi:murein DD-endopeptidase MepM/ murein hydrolase activator NlpD
VDKGFGTNTPVDVVIRPEDVIITTPENGQLVGVVENVTRSSKGDGNTVTIAHSGGYMTRYLHLDEIFVSQGQRVRRGGKIATVGMSGNAYAPHLHYEVMLSGAFRDPVNYLFGSVSPEEYPNFLFMSINTRQSMD